MTRGQFVTFEGGEGGGKSTQAKLLARALEAAGHAVVLTREPGGAPGAEEIRKLIVEGAPERWDALTEALLISAARREHVVRTIEPALTAGRWVVCDRFADSTQAYQGDGRGLDRAMLDGLRRLAVGHLMPDLTLILDLPVALGLERARRRAGNEQRFEAMDPAFHERLRRGFLAIAAAEPARCRVLDATAAIADIHGAVLGAVAERLGVQLVPASG
ncbi:MAG TPA: dTMP kinase [Candidatus Sulfotelmatobacter sp.]|nr:dTMP kinase [Candidatus Sulfotelmatobacter sp.]